jgi:hypothetical protein
VVKLILKCPKCNQLLDHVHGSREETVIVHVAEDKNGYTTVENVYDNSDTIFHCYKCNHIEWGNYDAFVVLPSGKRMSELSESEMLETEASYAETSQDVDWAKRERRGH